MNYSFLLILMENDYSNNPNLVFITKNHVEIYIHIIY